MKNRFLDFFRKDWLSFILCIIMFVGIIFSRIFGNVYISENSFYSFNLHTIYVFIGLPIFSLIYGCLSYIVCKKMWFQQILLATTLLLGLLIVEATTGIHLGTRVVIFLLISFNVLCSLLTSSITKLIIRIIIEKRTFEWRFFFLLCCLVLRFSIAVYATVNLIFFIG